MRKLEKAEFNLLLSRIGDLNGDTLLKVKEEVEIRLTKNEINKIVLDLIEETDKITSMEWEQLDKIVESFENNPLIRQHKEHFKDTSIFYKIIETISENKGLMKEKSLTLEDLVDMYEETIKALELIKTYKQTKTFINPVDIPVSWEKWLKDRLAGMEADGRLLKSKTKAKKKYKKKKTKSKTKRKK